MVEDDSMGRNHLLHERGCPLSAWQEQRQVRVIYLHLYTCVQMHVQIDTCIKSCVLMCYSSSICENGRKVK